MKFSLVSNTCVSMYLYNEYEPNIDKMFINYTNPFISSWIPNDEEYVRLCENYDKYIAIEPRFGEPINCCWNRDTGNKRSLTAGSSYLVMFLGDVEIHWIHDVNPSLLLKKFNGRLINSKGYEPIFLWSEPELYNIHTEEERKNLVSRFNAIKYKKIFLTKYPEEEYCDETTRIKFISNWKGKSQYDRDNNSFLLTWLNHPQLVQEFKKIIDDFEKNK